MDRTTRQGKHWKLWVFLTSLLGLLYLYKAATGEHEVVYRALFGIGFLFTVPQTILRRNFVADVPLRHAKVYDWLAWLGVIAIFSGLLMDLFNL